MPEHSTFAMLCKDGNKSLPPNGRRQALLALRRPLEALSALDSESGGYTVRRSARARRVSLRVLPGKGLEVVLPEWADSSLVPEVLERHKAWIRKTLGRMRTDDCRMPDVLPQMFLLRGGVEELHISVRGENASGVFSSLAPGGLGGQSESCAFACSGRGVPVSEPLRRDLVLPKGDLRSSLLRLREVLREEARRHLGARLEELSRQHGLRYTKMSVRFQKSRWGSCSVRGGISLNAGLLFLPDALTTYILRHELCHTRHMNHSESFWKLLFSLDADALAKDRAMRRAWRFVPSWLYVL